MTRYLSSSILLLKILYGLSSIPKRKEFHTHTHTHTHIEKENRNRQEDILEETKLTGSSNGTCLDIYADSSPPLFFKMEAGKGKKGERKNVDVIDL